MPWESRTQAAVRGEGETRSIGSPQAAGRAVFAFELRLGKGVGLYHVLAIARTVHDLHMLWTELTFLRTRPWRPLKPFAFRRLPGRVTGHARVAADRPTLAGEVAAWGVGPERVRVRRQLAVHHGRRPGEAQTALPDSRVVPRHNCKGIPDGAKTLLPPFDGGSSSRIARHRPTLPRPTPLAHSGTRPACSQRGAPPIHG
jgi:hypothetical protein